MLEASQYLATFAREQFSSKLLPPVVQHACHVDAPLPLPATRWIAAKTLTPQHHESRCEKCL